jgi:hypothetical protein
MDAALEVVLDAVLKAVFEAGLCATQLFMNLSSR